jgi:two-component sensor histidine kinase
LPIKTLTEQNVYLLELLAQAGLDSEQRDIAERVQAVLTNELHHRMKNMMAMVTAIVRQSLRASADLVTAEAAIGTRLIAMAKAHDILLKANWQAADLATVVHSAIAQHESIVGRIVIEGEDVEIGAAAILPLSLLFNELCTNATKYGALSKAGGVVSISWVKEPQSKSLAMRWVESGGPVVVAPGVKSFGTRLIESGIPRQFGGEGHLRFPASGAVFELTVPMAGIGPVAEAPAAADMSSGSLGMGGSLWRSV